MKPHVIINALLAIFFILSMGAIIYDPLIVFLFIFLIVASFGKIKKKISKKVFFICIVLFVFVFLFYVSISMYFAQSNSLVDKAMISLAQERLKRIYICHRDNRSQLPNLIDQIKENDKDTMLSNAIILIDPGGTDNVSQGNIRNFPLCIYFFSNVFKSKETYVVMFNNGDMDIITRSTRERGVRPGVLKTVNVGLQRGVSP